MAEAVVSGVVTRIGDLLVQEGKFLSGVSNQVELLQIELKLMQGLLKDADARQNESELVRQWVAEIRDLAYDADDIIATHAHTVGSRRKGGGVQKVLERCSGILGEGITGHQVGSKIEDIMTKISNLKTSFQGYGIREFMIKGGGSSSFNERQREQRQTFSHLEHDVVGFDDDLNKLVEFLIKEGVDNRVASICGMGGLGKITLAKLVYNYRKVKQHFDCRAWVYISQQCQRRRMLNDAEIVEKLRQVQCEKKCLVILDDIWNIEAWNSMEEAFLVRGTGSKILLTSRNKQVCLHINPKSFLCELQCLNEERSWELLDKIAIYWREDPMTKTYMEKFGKEMIGYCGGLPLAITVLGGLLAAKQTLEEWEDVLRHTKSYLHVEQNLKVNTVLALSYNDLPCHLKPCFLYLGHFPEDFEIPTKELIRMWMGEGFVSEIQDNRGREDTMDDVGNRYLRELVQRCMVLVGKMGSLGRIKTCRMHDLMRDFCISKAQEENFLHITNILSLKQREAQNSKVRRLAIILESDKTYIEGVKFNEYPYLRSLLYLLPRQSNSYFKESCFKKFKLVRVLHLGSFENHGYKLPKDIGCLIFLRYFSLKYSNVGKVPSSIGNLRCLETLDLRFRSNKSRVPNVFKYMKQLKYLYLPGSYRVYCKLELGNLSYLQTLVNVQPKTIQIPTWFKLNRLRVLKVMNNKRAQDAMQMLISRCPHIEKLHLYMHLKKLPEAHQFSLNLAKLTLSGTKLEEDPMETLEKLPNLKILCFRPALEKSPDSSNQFYICGTFNGKNMVCTERGFPLLQSLLLSGLVYLEEWRVEEGAMPSLCRLEIERCSLLKMIPDGLRFVTTLQELEIKDMPKSLKDRLNEGGPDFDKVKHVPSLVFQRCDY
ncbi:hypothetical protein ACB094_07G123600 [Castanea mollissima]